MSWAARRRFLYIFGLVLFFGTLIGVPVAYKIATIPATCEDNIQNQGETAPDRGGPCPRVDVRMLAPSGPLWARSFRVRDGSYTSAAYVQNPNERAGIQRVRYIFKLYDTQNVLVAERMGEMFVMPGGVTPVIETNIDAGNRIASRTFFEFTEVPLWEHLSNAALAVSVFDRQVTDTETVPRISAQARNASVSTLHNIRFIAVVFDTAGNAFAASETHVERLEAGEAVPIVFTWPTPFPVQVGRVDIDPLLPPEPEWVR